MYDSSSDSDEDGVYFRKPRTFKERINFVGITDPTQLREKFRMSKSAVEEVHLQIADKIRHATKRNFALNPMDQILLCLHWMGTGCQYHGVADMHGVYKSTVQRAATRVVEAVLEIMFPKEVKWPSGPEALDVCREFFTYAEFPRVAGCVDGSLFPIDAPKEHEAAYVDRKGDHSINATFVCGPKLQFYYASARWPGSVHDARVLRNSSLFEEWEGGWRPFPGAILLGDSGYPLLEWLLPPLYRANVDPQGVERFLRKHKATRRLVECALGILKERFPCLNHLRVEVRFAGKIILACATLHNIETRINGHTQFVVDEEENGDDAENEQQETVNATAGANAVYDDFISYFARN